jgi:hypothetical protein
MELAEAIDRARTNGHMQMSNSEPEEILSKEAYVR